MSRAALAISSISRRALHVGAGAAIAAATFAATPLTAHAQAPQASPSHVFTLNPFFVLAGWISGEYEQRVNNTVSLGAGASYVDFSDNQYTSVDFKVRLYPNEKALRGFEMGMGLGFTAVNTDTDDNDCNKGPCGSTEKTKVTTPAVSLEFGHQWNLGNNGRTILVLGGGGKRFLASKKDLNDTPRVIPFFRIGVGYGW